MALTKKIKRIIDSKKISAVLIETIHEWKWKQTAAAIAVNICDARWHCKESRFNMHVLFVDSQSNKLTLLTKVF
jgi:hypothetical protein